MSAGRKVALELPARLLHLPGPGLSLLLGGKPQKFFSCTPSLIAKCGHHLVVAEQHGDPTTVLFGLDFQLQQKLDRSARASATIEYVPDLDQMHASCNPLIAAIDDPRTAQYVAQNGKGTIQITDSYNAIEVGIGRHSSSVPRRRPAVVAIVLQTISCRVEARLW